MPSESYKHFIADKLLCPLTGGPLSFDGQTLRSHGLGPLPTTFDIPWVFRNPQEQILQWQNKVAGAADFYRQESRRAQDELQKVDLLNATKKRLASLAAAYNQSADWFSEFRSQLVPGVDFKDTQRVFLEKVPRQQTLMAYHDTLFRDWVWGKNEISLQADLIQGFLKDAKEMIVLGSGACGLPIEIHRRKGNLKTLCVDINPILLGSVKRILDGQSLQLIDYPKVPTSLDFVAQFHTVQKPKDLDQNFHLVLGDAQSLEFKSDAFDTLLTPWLIDIIPRDFRELCRQLNHHLVNGGRWVNIGLLDFRRYKLSEVYSPEEIAEALGESGFKVESLKLHQIPYLQGPHGMVGRQDQVLVFSAIKEKSAKKPARYEYLPNWLRDWSTPIPVLPQIKEFQIKTSVFANTISLVDGKLSLKQLSEVISKRFGLELPAAEESVYNFLVNVYEQQIFREY